jgi:polyisoprenoid-binding protein YceI
MQKSAKYALVAVALVILVGGAGFYWFVLRDDAPPRASLQTNSSVAGAPSDKASADGTWKVAPADNVFVGYRVNELFAGETIKKEAAGHTPAVEGTLTISGSTISAAEINADVSRLKSDRAARDSQIKTRGLQTNTFPQATFKLTKPITLPSAPVKGQSVEFTAAGELTLHGQTKTVDVPLKAQWDGGTISVAGSAPVVFSDYGMDPPTNGIVSVDDHGEFELQLTFIPA